MSNKQDDPLTELMDMDKKMRLLLRKLFPDGMTPLEIELFFSWCALDKNKKIFVDFVTRYLEVGRGDLNFALEQASKCTKEAMLKNLFESNRRLPKEARENLEDVVNSIDLLISEMTCLYTPPGKFGRFIIDVIYSMSEAKLNNPGFMDILNKLEFMLEFKLRSESDWKKQDYMSHDFALGYMLGMASPALKDISTWDNLKHFYPAIENQIESNTQSKNGKNRWGEWPSGMKIWLQERIKNEPKRTTKKSTGMTPTNTKFAKKIVKEAMEYKEKTYGQRWNSEERATEWICQTISELLNKNAL